MKPTRETFGCRQSSELVSDYLEDELAPSLRNRFESHLDDCTVCTSQLHRMRWALDVLHRLPGRRLSHTAKLNLLRAFRRWHRPD